MFELIDLLIVRPITNILFVIYGLVGDFGLAIIFFVVLVKICCWPLTRRQIHQTRLMRKIQPELAEIKKNCNGNKQLESLQMMDLYKRNNIKPFRSMLTIIIQLPIFIALYTAVRVMVTPTPTDNLDLRAYPVVRDMERIDHVINLQQTYLADINSDDPDRKAAAHYDFHPTLAGIVNLDARPGFNSASALFILACALIAAWIQYRTLAGQLPSKKSQKSRSFREIMKEAADGKEPDQSDLNSVVSGQMSKITPIMMLFVMLNLPGALVFYYMTSTILNSVQQKYIFSKNTEDMENTADKAIIRRLKKIEEAEIVSDSTKTKKSSKTPPPRGGQSGSGAKITRITAKSKARRPKKGHKKRSK